MEILVSVPDAPRVRLKSWRMDCGLKLKASVQVAPVAFVESILALSRNKTMLTARGLPLGTNDAFPLPVKQGGRATIPPASEICREEI